MDNIVLVERFLKLGANPNRQNNLGVTPIMLWCLEGWYDAVKLTLDLFPDIDLGVQDRWGKTAFDYASCPKVKELLESKG